MYSIIETPLKPQTSDSLIKPPENSEQLLEAVKHVHELINACGSNFGKHTNELVKCMVDVNKLIIGRWGYDSIADLRLVDLIRCLELLSSLSLSKQLQERSALWILIPLNRLIVEIELMVSCKLLKDTKLSNFEHGNLVSVLEDLLKQNAQSNAISNYVCELSSFIKAMLVDVLKHTGIAAGQIIVGAALSILQFKVDTMLLVGLYNGVMAGFEMFKRLKSDEALKCIREITHVNWEPKIEKTSERIFPLTYNELKVSSKYAKFCAHNWMLTTVYINNLFKTCSHAYNYIINDIENKENVEEAMRIVEACIMGDGSIIGLGTIFRKIDRKRPRKYKAEYVELFDNILNACTLTDFLRSTGTEAMGELTESLQLFDEDRLKQLPSLLTGISAIPKAAEFRIIISSLLLFEKAVFQFEKSITKARSHMFGIHKSLNIVKLYMNVLNLSESGWKEAKKVIDKEAKKVVDEGEEAKKVIGEEPNKTSNRDKCFLWKSLEDLKVSDQDKAFALIEYTQKNIEECCKKLNDIHSSLYEKKNKKAYALITWKKLVPNMRILEKYNPEPIKPNPEFEDKVVKILADPSILKTLETFLIKNEDRPTPLSVVNDCIPHLCLFTEVISKVDEMFVNMVDKYDEIISDQSPDDSDKNILKNLSITIKGVKGDIQVAITGLKNDFKDFIGMDCWKSGFIGMDCWRSLFEVWSKFASGLDVEKGMVMGALRKGFETLVDPGAKTDLVEEAMVIAVVDLLNISKSVTLYISSIVPNVSKSVTTTVTLYSRVNDHINFMDSIIAKERAGSPNVLHILSQSNCQSNVQRALVRNWQLIEKEIFESIKIQVKQQEALNLELHEEKTKDYKSFSENKIFIDTVHHTINNSQLLESVGAAKTTCQLLHNNSAVGLSGLMPALLVRLQHLEKRAIASRDCILLILNCNDKRYSTVNNITAYQLNTMQISSNALINENVHSSQYTILKSVSTNNDTVLMKLNILESNLDKLLNRPTVLDKALETQTENSDHLKSNTVVVDNTSQYSEVIQKFNTIENLFQAKSYHDDVEVLSKVKKFIKVCSTIKRNLIS